MSETPTQRFVPMLVYKDAPRAIEFLCDAFGFKENSRLDMPEARVGHAELEYMGHTVTLSSEYEEMGLVSPQSLSAMHCQIQCRVDDVNAHFEVAKAKGATTVEGLTDQFHGDRNYRTVDSEGFRWIFSQRMREVSQEELEAAVAEME
jgi:PhnB protein